MKKLNIKRVLIVFIPIIIILGVILFWIFKDKNTNIDPNTGKPSVNPPVEEKKVTVVDINSKTRPIAVMINNIKTAQPYQTGLQDAYIVYEIIVEGGISRMMAVYKDADTTRIGSVRSSRHYYLDYALENDAIYTHFGWSERAKADISSLGINNVNGLSDNAFWRDTSLGLASEHTAYTSMEKIKNVISTKGYRTETNKDLLLNYSIDEIDLSTKEGAIKANNIEIIYSNYQTTSYKYDSENKVYLRSMNGSKHIDFVTKKQNTAKNIITYQVYNESFDSYGRQDLSNTGTGKGYYITDGYAIPITWEKKTRSDQTVYKYLDGKEINVNDGNTFIQIQPKDQKLNITE